MKKLLLIVMCVALVGITSCGKQNKVVEENAQAVVDAFTNGDIATINEVVFGINNLVVDEEISDILGESTESQEGILTHIFELVTVKVKKITDSKIEYEVEAPDMSNVFSDIGTNEENISQDELLDYIKHYAQNAKIKTTKVSLEYYIVDDEPVVKYQDESFINAVTGGLLDAYKTLYSEIMEEYMEGVY